MKRKVITNKLATGVVISFKDKGGKIKVKSIYNDKSVYFDRYSK